MEIIAIIFAQLNVENLTLQAELNRVINEKIETEEKVGQVIEVLEKLALNELKTQKLQAMIPNNNKSETPS